MALPIKSLVNTIFAGQNDWRLQIIRGWSEIMGPLHKKVSLQKIENNTAFLTTTDSCWLAELYMFSELIKNNINALFDEPRIKNIRLSLKPIQESKSRDLGEMRAVKIESIDLTVDEKQALNIVKDVELQKALEQFLIRCKYNDR